MAHRFVIMRNNVLETYNEYEDIPLDLQHVIEFIPEISEGTHTEDEHNDISSWTDKLQYLMEIERTNSKKQL